MPSENNVTSPINLVSFGRSGTSLISAMLYASPEIDFVGETAQLIFFTWLAAERSLNIVRTNLHGSAPVARDDFCAAAVRGAFRAVFPSSRSRWLQKPIGVPEAFWLQKATGVDCAEWYWTAMNASFPDALTFTVLRNPIDVAVSAHLYWGYDCREIVAQLGEMADLIVHPRSRVAFAVDFNALTKEPSRQIQIMCERLHLDFAPSMLDAMNQAHAERQPADKDKIAMTLAKVLAAPALDVSLAKVAAMWRAFGYESGDFRQESRYTR